MHNRRLMAFTSIALLTIWSAMATAFAPSPDSRALEIPLPEAKRIDRPTHHMAANQATALMEQRYGGTWHVGQWNMNTRTPESLYGSGVQVSGGELTTDQAALAAAFGFVAANPEVLGVEPDNLVVERVVRGMGKVAVHYAQDFHGIPVLDSRVRAVFTESGRLFYLGSTYQRDIAVNPVPLIDGTQAASIAKGDLPFNPVGDFIDGDPELRILAVPQGEAGVIHHLVWRVRVVTAEPYGIWVSHVDAHTGTIVYRYNDLHFLYSGTSQGDVEVATIHCDPADLLPFREMTVNVSGLGSVVTAADGGFSFPDTGGDRTITAQFDGPQNNVNRQDGADAQINTTIQEGVPFITDWSAAHEAERDCFYWVNETDAFVKGIDPTYNHGKYTSNVNVNQTCNANWGGNVMNFFREGGGCGNTGTIGDVMAHEFGHGVQDDLLGSQGGQGLGEGNGDILGSFMVDDSIIGRGFFLNNCVSGIRDCDNTLSYPGDVIGQEIHFAGQVICGFNWDLRLLLEAKMGQAAGKAYTGDLWHFSRKLFTPSTQPAQVEAYFLVDDDDGNPNNGTPNYDEICAAATNHGFGPFCPEIFDIVITHDPLPWTMDHASDYGVSATVTSALPGGSITSVSLFYQVDGAGFIEVPMANFAGPDVYSAVIPAQAGDVTVDYYIQAIDNFANTRTLPGGAPAEFFSFLVFSDDLLDDFEVATGWLAGATGDNASTGIWERVDPIGTAAQPEDDHTPAPGVLCFVTGQCGPPNCGTCSLGCNDVDGGTTTLLSPRIDMSPATQDARISYWRWYSNNTGASPNADNWVVDVSNDGGQTWTNFENVNPPNAEQGVWLQKEIDILAMFGTPGVVQVRFKASDLGSGSLVEAAVDDVLISVQGGTTGIDAVAGAPEAAGRFAVDEPRPNPFNPRTMVSYEIPAEGAVVVAIFDGSGRLVRTLVDGPEEAGRHAIEWDGRGDAGQELASGVYHVRVTTAGAEATRKLVLLK